MSIKPIGYFVHHQGRGHAERCAALVNALPAQRPVTVFCARPEILPAMRHGVDVVKIPSLFEPTGQEAAGLDHIAHPDTVHCAPLGWPGIRTAMSQIAEWLGRVDPALLISDVSAEVAQLARLCSVPHVSIVQHGHRDDPGHRAGWVGAAGMLAPFDRVLAQTDWPDALLDKTCFAGGLGVSADPIERDAARQRLGLSSKQAVFLAMSGAGGDGLSSAALAIGARSFPDTQWHTIGPVQHTWHASEPGNLLHHGWVDNAADYLAAADLIIGSVGNTTTQQVLAAGKPWMAVPQWCYFDEQACKAQALDQAGLAHHEPYLPSHAARWREAVALARTHHDATRQRAAVRPDADRIAARWVEDLCRSLWQDVPTAHPSFEESAEQPAKASAAEPISVLTIAAGRADHLHNLIVGLQRQTRPPAELVIGVMQEQAYEDLPAAAFPIRQILIEGDVLPLARARNTVARQAASDVLIFLDVDCVPSATFVADYADRVHRGGGLMMGEVRYLPEGAASQGWTYATFERDAIVHDARADAPVKDVQRCEDYRCFWSLNFALHRDTFDAAGGFDERYAGYGGEDTDFGRTLTERGIPLSWMRGARVYHQYHDQRMPPVHHLESVVRNAELFERKWGHRTMDHWLYCFGLMGLIEDSPGGLRILQERPCERISRLVMSTGAAYASTDRAIERLEADAVARYRGRHGTTPPVGWLDRKRFLHRPPGAPDKASRRSADRLVS